VYQKLTAHKNLFSIFLLLVAASLVCVLLTAVRMERSDTARYAHMRWNLMLAWIPFLFAALAYALANARRRILYPLVLASAGTWLLFFPNAPYILTDFQHLSRVTDGIPVWYDVILLIWFAWTGLLLGVVSLYMMQEIVTRSMGKTAGWLFVILVSGLTGFGVYVGRFMRWNSWDIWHQPLPLLQDIWNQLRHPLANKDTFVFTIIFSLLLLFIYLAMMLLGNLKAERQKQQVAVTHQTKTV